MKTRQLVIAFLAFGFIMVLYFGPTALINQFWLGKTASSRSVDHVLIFIQILNLAFFLITLGIGFMLPMSARTWDTAGALVLAAIAFGFSLAVLRDASQTQSFYSPATGEVIGFSTREETRILCEIPAICISRLGIKEIPVIQYRFKDALGAWHEATLDRIPGTAPALGSKKDLLYDRRDPFRIRAYITNPFYPWDGAGLFLLLGLIFASAAGFRIYRIRKAEKDVLRGEVLSALRDDKSLG